jgi:ABC-type amino acid transport substrate-binding protein
VTDIPYALVTRGDRHPMAARIDAALAGLLADGAVTEIIDRWL